MIQIASARARRQSGTDLDRSAKRQNKITIALLLLLLTQQYLPASNVRVTSITYQDPTGGTGLPYVPRWCQYAIDGTFNCPSGMEVLYSSLITSGAFEGFYAGAACFGPPGTLPANVCPSSSNIIYSTTNAFNLLVWGSTGVNKSVWCQWAHKLVGFAACAIQDANSQLQGFGLPVSLAGTVSTNGTAVTWVSGSFFNRGQPNANITINGTTYPVATFNSATSLTLGSSAGVQTGVSYSQVVSTGDPGVGGNMHIDILHWNTGTGQFDSIWQVDSNVCATYCGGGTPGTAQGFAANGTRVVTIDGTGLGGWFVGFSADDSKIAWSNDLCVEGIVSPCSDIYLGNEIEIAYWSPGSNFAGTCTSVGAPGCTASISQVLFESPFSGGAAKSAVTCTGNPATTGTCNLNTPQLFYEFEDWHKTDPLLMVIEQAFTGTSGNPFVLSLHPPGSTNLLFDVCPSPFTDIHLCNWNEHSAWSPDGVHIAVASSAATQGPIVTTTTSWATGSSVLTGVPIQNVAWVSPLAANQSDLISLTQFNNPSAPEYVQTGGAPTLANLCHNRNQAVQFSPDNTIIMLGAQQTVQSGGVCPGGHGAFGQSMLLLGIQPETELRGGASISGGVQLK